MKLSFLNSIFTAFFDPLEQFLILPFGFICPGTINNITLTLFIIIISYALLFGSYEFNSNNRCSPLQYFLFNLAKTMNEEYIHHHYQAFFPIIHFILLFTLGCNFCGLIPYSFTITSSLIVTLALSVMFQLGINITGIFLNKIKFLILFLPAGTPLIIAPFLVLIELISYFARILSLAIRLFVNMMAGHALMKILVGFTWTMFSVGSIFYGYGILPLIIFSLVACLEVLISFLQSYIFTVLLSIYINDAINLH